MKIYYTAVARIKARLWGVRLGCGCSFRGKVIFYKTQGSSIVIGDNCRFNSLSEFNFRGLTHPTILQTGKSGARITIGHDCGFSSVSIVSDVSVTVGDNVLCGANVIIGDRNDHEDRYPKEARPVEIGDNVWIGMNSTIMGGVKISNNSMVGANSLVTKDIPPYEVWAGIPAKFIKKINK